MVVDIAKYLEELEDIPGTRIFTAKRARQGYALNQCAMSLMNTQNRARFKEDERAYLDEWQLSDDQKDAIIARDYNRCIDLGGNIYFLAKLISTDGQPFAEAVSTMTDMGFVEYQKMMSTGGRSPDGLRSKKEGR